jgi:tetratricopeptide (TPR) repeat protein
MKEVRSPKKLGRQNTEFRIKKILYIILLFLFFGLIFSPDIPASTAKRPKHFQIGEEILSHIIEAGNTDFLSPKSLRGKTVLMVFAAAEQEFSQKALQDIQNIVDRLKLKKFTAIGIVSSSKGHQEVQRLIEKHRLKYQVLYDEGDIATQLKILVYPTTLIIDRKGRLAYYYSLYTSNYHDVILAHLKRIIDDKAQSYINEQMAKRKQKEGVKKAREEIERGNVKSAVTALTNLLRKGHDSYNIHLLLGYSFIRLHDPGKALAHFKKAKDIQPGSTSVDLGMGIAYSRAGQKKNAVSILTKIAKNDPDSVFAYRELSRIFEEKNEVDKAIYYIKKELEGLTLQAKD